MAHRLRSYDTLINGYSCFTSENLKEERKDNYGSSSKKTSSKKTGR